MYFHHNQRYCAVIHNLIWFEIPLLNNLIYKDECLYLIQNHISGPIGTKLCTHLPCGMEETVGYVWAHNISPFPTFRPILSRADADSCAVDGCLRHTSCYSVISVMRCMLVWRHTRWVVQWKCGEVNGMCVCENGNLIRREGSD